MKVTENFEQFYRDNGYLQEQINDFKELAENLEYYYWDEDCKTEFCAYECKNIKVAKKISEKKAIELLGIERFLPYVWRVCFGVKEQRSVIPERNNGKWHGWVVAHCTELY